MADSATAVIFGRVVNRVTGPTVISEDEPIDGEYTLGGYEVEVVELIAGGLPVGDETILFSTYLSAEATSDTPALMFLRWKGEAYQRGLGETTPEVIRTWDESGYRLVSSQGLFIDSPAGAWNPILMAYEGYLENDPTQPFDPVARQAQQLSIDEIVELVLAAR